MPNNPFSTSHSQSDFSTRSAKFDMGRVTQVKSHERGDKIAHYVKVRTKQMDVDREAIVKVPLHGDVNPPVVDDYVIIAYRKGEKPLLLGQYYPVEDSMDGILKSYDAGERILGHPNTDASILFEKNGNIKIINADEMPNGRLKNGDIRTHDGTYVYYKNEDIFVHPNRDKGGNVYGVSEPHIGVIQAPTSPQTVYYNLGFQPRQIMFRGNLHNNRWNEPFWSLKDGDADKYSMADSMGYATLTPMYVDSTVNTYEPPHSSSTTPPREDEEPFKDVHLNNVTQHVQSKAWYSNMGTEHRSYIGDNQVIRLIKGKDESMNELGRVEARITKFDENGFELEWFASQDESGSTYLNTGVRPIINFVVHT